MDFENVFVFNKIAHDYKNRKYLMKLYNLFITALMLNFHLISNMQTKKEF